MSAWPNTCQPDNAQEETLKISICHPNLKTIALRKFEGIKFVWKEGWSRLEQCFKIVITPSQSSDGVVCLPGLVLQRCSMVCVTGDI